MLGFLLVDTRRSRQGHRVLVHAPRRDRPLVVGSVMETIGFNPQPATGWRCGARRVAAGSAASSRLAAAPAALGVKRTQSRATTSAMSSPASVGFCATVTPAAASASIFACAVPLPPETIAPAWPIFLPAGAVTPAT